MWRLCDLRFSWQCWWIKVFWDVSLCRLLNILKGHGAPKSQAVQYLTLRMKAVCPSQSHATTQCTIPLLVV
jgi:hypothetical protein